MSFCIFCQFNARFSVLDYDVASNVWFALLSDADNAVVAAGFNVVTPADRSCSGGFVVADNFDAVFVRLFNCVVYYQTLVV